MQTNRLNAKAAKKNIDIYQFNAIWLSIVFYGNGFRREQKRFCFSLYCMDLSNISGV